VWSGQDPFLQWWPQAPWQTTPQAGQPQAQGRVKIIDNPGGGRIFLGPIAGQPTPEAALGNTLHRLSNYCGDRPQLGRLVKGKNGEILTGFFTVNAARQDGKPMTGMVMALTPKNGSAVGAVLMDYANRFPTTVNPMFATLKQQLAQSSEASGGSTGGAGGAGSQAEPAQPLQRQVFPDGTGVIGLPAGWQVKRAHMGDVTAVGPHNEKLRFGLTIPIEGNGRRLGGNFLSIAYGTDPATAYKSAITQMSRAGGKQAPEIDVTKVQEIPMQGGKNYFLYGNLDAHDGVGRQFFIAQMLNSQPQAMGTWQMTLFQVNGPEQVMAAERATIASIYPNYGRDSNRVNQMANIQIQQGIEQTNQFCNSVRQHIDNSDRATAGMSDILRQQSVIVDTQDGSHGRTSDEMADWLVKTFPDRYQVAPLSQYQSGIDY
jgi:hypothetical protein